MLMNPYVAGPAEQPTEEAEVSNICTGLIDNPMILFHRALVLQINLSNLFTFPDKAGETQQSAWVASQSQVSSQCSVNQRRIYFGRPTLTDTYINGAAMTVQRARLNAIPAGSIPYSKAVSRTYARDQFTPRHDYAHCGGKRALA